MAVDCKNGSAPGSNGAVRKSPAHPTLGIPELAGVCTYAESERPGLGVDQR